MLRKSIIMHFGTVALMDLEVQLSVLKNPIFFNKVMSDYVM